jgi:transaldolase
MPESTIAAFEDHGRLERTLDRDLQTARATLASLEDLGVDMDDVGATLEQQGVAAFHDSFRDVLAVLDRKATALIRH